mgnify:CR=1 FL=1
MGMVIGIDVGGSTTKIIGVDTVSYTHLTLPTKLEV